MTQIVPLSFRITAYGDEIARVDRNFRRMGGRAVYLKPILENEILTDMRRVVDATMRAQGRRYGGSWKFLTKKWLDRKIREGKDPRIMFYTHRLHDSLMSKTDDSVLSITNDRIVYGSDRPGAESHQKGKGRQPKRSFIDFHARDEKRWADMIQKAIIGEVR